MTTTPHLLLGDCAEKMRDLADNSVDAIVTDPPYALVGSSGTGGFMGAKWDSELPTVEMWKEALRVAKPGAHLLAFGGTRTYHRLACAIEDAGWEIRDCIMWVYGSGFPKSMDVSKAIDKALGAKREKVPNPLAQKQTSYHTDVYGGQEDRIYKQPIPATDAAAEWNGWGTCLKPAVEPIVVARKPLEGTVAANVLKHGTGAINIDGGRVPTENAPKPCIGNGYRSINDKNAEQGYRPNSYSAEKSEYVPSALGRFPANLIHDGSDEVLALFPESKGQCGAVKGTEPSEITNGIYGKYNARLAAEPRGDTGSAARFFYCAKASRKERDGSDHPTMKPLALMRYLVRLVTRKGGIVLDPFMGSGTTGVAAIQEGMNFVGIERDPHYYDIAKRRINGSTQEPLESMEDSKSPTNAPAKKETERGGIIQPLLF